MEAFFERIISKKKDMKDIIFIICIICAGLIIFSIILRISYLRTFSIVLLAAEIFGIYYLIRIRNIEYEYSFSGGDLKIVKIVAKSKRREVFSSNCRDFNTVARLTDPRYNQEIGGTVKKLDFTSTLSHPDVFFITINYSGQKTMLFLEINQNMLKTIKMFIPNKVFE